MLLFEPQPEPPKIRFQITGNVASTEFQICRCYTQRLHKSFPKDYLEPDIRPLLDVDWNLFLKKLRRNIGGEKTWTLQKRVAVFIDGEFLGDDSDLKKFVASKYKMYISKKFEKLGTEQLIEYLLKQSELGRNFVYLTIAVDASVIGTMLILLYSDLVPRISTLFLKLCKRTKNGFSGTPIHRIAKPSWIQCGGWNFKHKKTPCENYVIAHDKRGVLSMCNNGKHVDNFTQFFITLEATPWMDYKYVAFGQLLHGDEVLKTIENLPTRYESPMNSVQIVSCGEYNLCTSIGSGTKAMLHKYLCLKDDTCMHIDVIDPRDIDSLLLEKYYLNMYTQHPTYLPSYHDDEEEGNFD